MSPASGTPVITPRHAAAAALAAALMPAIVPGADTPPPTEPIDIGSRRELFVDDLLVGELTGGADRRLHAPQPREVVLELDKPWEGVYSGYFTVLDDSDRLRLYYRGMPEAKHDFDTEVTCYAESTDGIAWTRPNLGLFEVRGTRDNNVVLARHRACHNFAPFIDTRPGCPADQRYKALGGTGEPGLVALASADGIHWRDLQPDPVITEGAFDSQNVSFWSESEQRYVCYFRVFREGVRWIARTTSDDFLHWSDPVDLALGDGPAQHHYTNQLAPYVRAPHLYLGTPTRFMPGRRALASEGADERGLSEGFDFRNDCADILLISTRGGGPQLDRSFLEAFIRPGPDPRNWTSRASYAAHGIIPTGDQELSVFVNRNCGYPTTHLQRFTLRPDGFASIHAPFAGGGLVTRPLVFDGGELTLNFATSAAGSLRVGIEHPDGRAIDGFSVDDCPELIGDRIDHPVAWKDRGADVSGLANTPVRLRFVLSDADLYSLRFRR